MTQNIREFIGMKKDTMTRADELLDSILITIFEGFEIYFNIQRQNYSKLEDFFHDFLIKHPNKEYVANWFFTKGIPQLNQLDTPINIVFDIEAFLEYEQFILDTDITEGTMHDFLYSITEIIPAINTYVSEYYEEAINGSLPQQEDVILSSVSLINDPQSFITDQQALTWSVEIPKSSANKEQAELLLSI